MRDPSFISLANSGMILFTQRSARRASRRRGAVLLEMALVLTVLLALTFGVMEYGHYVYARHTLEGASQRGCRTAILRDITETEVSAAVQELMGTAGYDETEYTLAVTGLDDPEATDVSVTITAEWGTIGIRPMGLISADSVVHATVTMRKEGP